MTGSSRAAWKVSQGELHDVVLTCRQGQRVRGSIEESADEPEEPDYLDLPVRPDDPMLPAARTALEKLFEDHPRRVFYERQLVVLLEGSYFHWITLRALHAMRDEGVIESAKQSLFPSVAGGVAAVEIRFYWMRRNRYWRRQARRIQQLVASFSTEQFGHALGRHGETMFDAALPKVGFRPVAERVNIFGERKWTATNHNLDRVFERGNIYWGAEIKNKLPYIDQEQLETKLAMCGYLGLRPLFIMRHAPKSYVYQIFKAGGFALLFRDQLYPHGYEALAKTVRTELGLPVDSPQSVPIGHVERFSNWHRERLGS